MNMLKRLLIIGMVLFYPLNVFNGNYQTTKIEFSNIEGTCYGTLLSRKTVSGSWSVQKELDIRAPKKVITFFSEFKDEDNFFYLNYLQDVSEGLLYWPFYPPEEFRVLLYYPDTDSYAISDTIISRYALCSTFKATINDGVISLSRNYNYTKLIFLTLSRTLIFVAVSFLVTLIYGQPRKRDLKYFFISDVAYQLLLNILISIYSFKNGFTIVEYYLIMWIPYLIFFVIQGYYYTHNSNAYRSPYMCTFLSNLAAYVAGILLVDVMPQLFTLIQ